MSGVIVLLAAAAVLHNTSTFVSIKDAL